MGTVFTAFAEFKFFENSEDLVNAAETAGQFQIFIHHLLNKGAPMAAA